MKKKAVKKVKVNCTEKYGVKKNRVENEKSIFSGGTWRIQRARNL